MLTGIIHSSYFQSILRNLCILWYSMGYILSLNGENFQFTLWYLRLLAFCQDHSFLAYFEGVITYNREQGSFVLSWTKLFSFTEKYRFLYLLERSRRLERHTISLLITTTLSWWKKALSTSSVFMYLTFVIQEITWYKSLYSMDCGRKLTSSTSNGRKGFLYLNFQREIFLLCCGKLQSSNKLVHALSTKESEW